MTAERHRTALVVSLLALACAPAAAQQLKVDDDAIKLEQVEVTGSHLRRVDMETQHPVLVIEREALLRTGLTDVGDILQTITSNGQTLNRNINNGGNGEARLNLRSLGDNRTLVLLDGQRFVSGLEGAVDLTAIPLALVERVEVLRDGASAIYGSDAIAGVVNIVTRRAYTGGEASAYFGENYSYSDGQRRAFDLTYGAKGEGWSAAAGATYSKDEPIFARDRAISRLPYYGLPLEATGSLTSPYSRLILASGGGYRRLIDGRPGTSPEDFRPLNPATDGYNYTVQNYLQTPQERRALFAQGRYEFSPKLAFSANLLRNERLSSQQLAEPVVSFSPFLLDPAGNSIGIAADNVYNPFGEAVVTGSRRFSEAGPRRFEQKTTTTRLGLGLDGLFALGARDFTWSLNYSATRADSREFVSPYADNSRLALALGPSFRDASGVARCGSPGAVIAGCVPLNLFGPPGSITPEMLDYVGISAHNRKRSDSRDLQVHAAGDVFDLPAGPVGLAVGYERRDEEGYNRPDAVIASGNANGTGVTYDATEGSYAVDEVFAELNLPLLEGQPFARQLDVSLASRYSDYSEFGGTTNSQFGLRWKPVDDLLVRGNIAEGFRAPSLFDLYSGNYDSIGPVTDPCAAANSPSAQTLARCQAAGVPVDVIEGETYVTYGGNRELKPERALSRSLGLVYSPQWLEGLEVNLDWYRIQIRDAIGDRTPEAVLGDCYDRGDAAACRRIVRAPDGSLYSVVATAQNLPGGLETEGVDFGLTYRRTTSAGNLAVVWDNAYVDYYGELHQPARNTLLPDGTLAQGNIVADNRTPGGFYTVVWRLRSNLSLQWQRDDWSASVGARYFSPGDEDCSIVTDVAEYVGQPNLNSLCSRPYREIDVDGSGTASPAPQNRVASVTYFDLEASWQAPWNAKFTLGVRNAFDRDPPVAYSTQFNSFFADFDVPGRYWYASYRQRF
ncbi:TonB-dependent receptor plug domain-containing protein [Tahibacter caeni]|uniref:TonB-dependent receptor plug domain-containing protein n=1 Tax=Tahibacter caeni TaxID=1453545 RepID=UPI002147E185|nr:TonB-dependent receptor [Tahibacter caeni]